MSESPSQHPLIELAKRKPYTERPEMPHGAVYCDMEGVWRIDGAPAARLFGRVTKKCDQETGEDQKGE